METNRSDASPKISVEHLAVAAGKKVLLDDVSFTVQRGEWICVIGPNGAGKSTLLRALAGLATRGSGLKQTKGVVCLGDHDLYEMPHRQRSKRIAWVPQTPIIPDGISVTDYVLLGRTPHLGLLSTESKHDLAIAQSILAELDIERLADRMMHTLSGGERQRAVIGRALTQEADIILLDEPTSALDIGHQQELLALLSKLQRDAGRTIISTMHDLTLAGQAADRLILIDDGRVVVDGAPVEVLTKVHLQTVYGATLTVLDHNGAKVIIPTVEPRLPSPSIEEGST